MRCFVATFAVALVVPAVPAFAAPPQNPSETGQCVSETAMERMGKPAQPSVSFPFECPPPPPFRGEAP